MAIPTVRSCCCGCSLRTGSIIIGVLSLLGSLSALTTPSDSHVPELNKVLADSTFFRILYIAYYVACVVLSGVLLFGIFTDNRTFVFTNAVVKLPLDLIALVLMFGYLTYCGRFDILIGGIIGVLLTLYFTCVVYSLSEEMKQGSAGHA